jgi:prophage antirepressor-like protein
MVEAPNVASVVPNVACEPVMLPANVASKPTATTGTVINTKDLLPFTYGDYPIRCSMIDGEPWWVLRDVCAATGYIFVGNATALIEREDLQKIHTLSPQGTMQPTLFVNEPGLYQFLSRTQTEGTRPFQRWLFKEVLPSIRKTGQYQLTPQAQIDPIDAAILSLQRIKQIETMQVEQQKRQAELEQQIKQIAIASPADADKVANNAVQKIQALNTKRRELQKLVSAIVGYAKDSPKALAHSYRNYQQVWHFVFDKSNPPVNKLADYTTHAQINTGIDAAKNLLSELTGKTQTEQLKINIESDEIA